MVETLLGLLRGSREGDWELHLSSISEIVPWCFAYDNLNYARYLSAYLHEMSRLPEEHPDILEYLRPGGFSVQMNEDNPFVRIPVDQTFLGNCQQGHSNVRRNQRFQSKA